jgi:anti-sigma B factor antagonist
MVNLTLQETSGIAVVSALPDVLDAGNAAQFKAGIAQILEGKKQAVFDMSTVHFIDSAGCGALITALWHLKDAGGMLKLFGVGTQVSRVFELVRIYKIIDIYKTRKQALDSFRLE